MSTPILPLAVWDPGTLNNANPANDNSLRLQILNGLVIGTANDESTPADGDIYIVGSAPTGAYAAFDENDLTIYMSGTWYAFAPVDGIVVNVAGTLNRWDGAAYVPVTSGSGSAAVAVQYVADTGSTADSDPGAGLLKWNNATQASATQLFLDDDSSDGVTLTALWAGLDAGGFLYLQHATDQDTWQIWEITSVTDATGYVKFAVSLLADGGSFADDDPMLVTFQQGVASGSAAWGSITGTLSAQTDLQAALTAVDTRGKQAIYVAAGAMRPSFTGGCASLAGIASAANQPDIVTLDFDPNTQEYAQFGVVMPKKWNEGTVTFKAHWSHASTTTNFGVVWDLQAVAVSDDDPIAVAFGTAQTSTDTGGTTNDLYTSPESSAITVAGTPAAEDMVFFRLSRVTGNGSDTMTIDARLHGITLYVTTDASTDA